GSAHHTDMPVSVNETFTFFTILIGAVEYRKMFFFQHWCTLQHHGTAHIIIRSFDLAFSKSESFKQAPFKIIVLIRSKAKSLQAFFTQSVLVKYKTDFESRVYCIIQFLNFRSNESFLTQCLVIDIRSAGKCLGTYSIFNDRINFFLTITQVLQCEWHRLVNDFEIATT